MKREKYNCPNCGAPIEYSEECQYCGTALDWTPTVELIIKAEPRVARKCIVAIPERAWAGITEDFITEELQREIGIAASEIWERDTLPVERAPWIIAPPGTIVHTATVYFAVKEEQE